MTTIQEPRNGHCVSPPFLKSQISDIQSPVAPATLGAQPQAKNPHAVLGAEGAPDATPASAASDDPVVERQKGVRITPLLAHEKVLPVRCQFTFSDGRQCTMGRSEIHPSLCPYHAEREEQLFGVPSPGGTVVGRAFDLPELYAACRDLTTAAGVNRALAQVFRLLAQLRISRQEAATFGHLAQLLLRTISLMHSSRESHGDQELSRVNEVTAGPTPNVYPLRGNVYPSAGESHGHQELSPVHKVELSPRDKVPSTFVPQPRDPGTPPETPVIPNPPSADVSHNQRAQTAGSNSRNMNTCTEPVSNPNKMNTYEIAELKVVQNEHLHQESRRDDTTIAQRGSTGTRSIRKLIPSPERGDTP